MPGQTKQLEYRIGADFGEVRREAESTGNATRKFMRELDKLEKQQREHRRSLEDLGRGFLTFGAAMAAGLGFAAKAAMDWETAFTGVRKTVDGSDAEIAALEQELRQLARTLPATHKEIAAVAEAAGQLGIKREDIAEFTKTMIDLGETTNLSAEEAATGLAKFSNIMGVTAKDVDRLGSTLVALGNDGASTEKDILEMSLRIAGAGRTVGLTADQVMAFASSLSSVGIEAEAGGTAISTVMIKLASAAKKGGAELELFAKVAGTTSEEFKTAFETDASGALIQFVQGLGKMKKQGEDVFGTLENLSLADVRVRDTLLRAASASDVFTKSLQVGARGWAENMALTEEANKRYETSAAKVQVAGNQIKDALIDVGAVVLPVVGSITQGASDLALAFQNLPDPLKDVVSFAGLAAAGIGLIGGAALIAGPKILAFRDRMGELVDRGGAASKALGKFGLFMSGPWGAAIGIGVTLLGAFGIAAGAAERKQTELASAGKSVAQALREQNGVVNETVRMAAAKAAEDNGMLSAAKGLGIELASVTDAILDQGNAYGQLKTKLQDVIKAGTEVTPGGKSGTITRYNDEAIAAQELLRNLDDLVAGKNADVAASSNVDEASKHTTESQKALAEQMVGSAKATEDAAAALDDLISKMNELNSTTLTAREAERNYVEQVKTTAEVLKKNGATLDINTEKGMENSRALDAQAKAANSLAEAVAKEAEQTGGAAAGAAALAASLEASRPALLAQAMAFGMGEAEAKAYVDQVLAIPSAASTLITTPGSEQAIRELETVQSKVRDIPPNKSVNVGVLSEAAKAELAKIGYTVTTLPNGTVTVSGNTSAFYSTLNSAIAFARSQSVSIPLRVQPNAAKLRKEEMARAHGGIVEFAAGGMFEKHTAQIARARAGTVRMWAEPDTGRESYIPWARDRRAGALSVLRSTAEGFGYAIAPKSQFMGGPTITQVIPRGPVATVEFRSDGSRVGDLLIELVRKTVRVQGGNVQTVLGS